MSEIKYRLAELSDVKDLSRLRILMQSEVRKIDPGVATPQYLELLDSYFREGVANGTYLGVVAEANSKIIGSAGIVIYNKPPSMNDASGLLAYVTNVYTAIPWRKKGIAGGMMQMLVKMAEERNVMRMNLGATEDGVNVYKRVGFRFPKYPQLELDFRERNR